MGLKQRILKEMVRTKDDDIIDEILRELPTELRDRKEVEKLYWKYKKGEKLRWMTKKEQRS